MPTDSMEDPPAALPSVRGLVLAMNTHGAAIGRTTLRQWLRLSAEKFKTQKVDLYLPHAETDVVLPLLEEAAHRDLRLSLRCTDATSPEILSPLAKAGLFDVALQPTALDAPALEAWFDAAAEAQLPVRLYLDAARIPDTPEDELLAVLTRAVFVQIALRDEITLPTSQGPLRQKAIENIVGLVEALRERHTDVHCLDLPFCQMPEALWPTVFNIPQRLVTHQHYRPSALEFAQKLRNLSPGRIHQAVEIALSRGATFHSLIDDAVLPWILERPRFFFWTWFLHKLTRRLPLRRMVPTALPEELSDLEAQLAAYQQTQRQNLGPECARCRLHPVCDHPTEAFKQAFPGRPVRALPGEPCYDPRILLESSDAWHDAIDARRCIRDERSSKLVEIARNRIARERPTREIPAESYSIQDHKTHRMPASIRWFSFSTAELQSTVLATLSPPFTLSVTIGGGIAQHMGFALGRHTRLLCPMTACTHKLTLHVDGDGHYVLLRDTEHVIPAAFANSDQVPERIGSVVEPRIVLANIDGQIVTQTVLVWEGEGNSNDDADVAHSVVIVCSRYARRLQAALLALTQQKNMAPSTLEVIVGYIPGLDATDDVLDSIAAQFPEIRLVRMPFASQHACAKGFLINECLEQAHGAWITLLDADIMLPPDYFERLDAQPDEVSFVSPEGRHMLTPEATAEVLLGLSQPWENYEAALAASGEYRHRESEGVPPGFCQSLRRHVFDAIRYQELDHFEGSDWWFSAQVIEKFGKETRLKGLRVLHLDHGGSQWYGTDKQF